MSDMRRLLFALVLSACAGCLTASRPLPVAEWLVDCKVAADGSRDPKFGVARFSQLAVRAPYDALQFAVLRADGTVAFDDYNRFAAAPSQLLKGAVLDVLKGSGLFRSVVGSSSAATADLTVEVTVERLCLDCRAPDARRARAAVSLLLLDRSRTIMAEISGESSSDAAAGNYAEAFASALSGALEVALGRL